MFKDVHLLTLVTGEINMFKALVYAMSGMYAQKSVGK